ncbi:MAG: TraR/DksA C4-type zinc finger protein [Desulfobacteraceae bacterium]|jgi:DnaK suppressor protein
MTNSEQLQFKDLRQLLEDQMTELVNKAKETVYVLSKEGDSSADPLDRATMDSGRESSLRFRERESRLIRKIVVTLRKMDEGVYGICESCGDDIPFSRLKARPVTSYCIQCKTKMETYEKAVGI